MDDRYIRNGPQGDYYERSPETVRDFGSGRDYTYSSARDYAAAGELGRGREYGQGREFGRGGRDFDRAYGRETGRRDYGGSYWDDGRRTTETRGRGRFDDDRGFLDRAGDEVRSWFGDEEAERRREIDRRRMREQDEHYGQWRSSRLAEFDRDYDEYRRENQSRFESEFGSWRERRQQKRSMLGGIREHMEVVGNDDQPVGTVDRVAGDRIILTKSDPQAGGHHHSISCGNIDRIEDNRVILDCSADQAKQNWRDDDRSRSLNEREDQGEVGPHILNRSFEGTYR